MPILHCSLFVSVCENVRPALAGVELEEDAETVSEAGVVLGDGVVPHEHQTGQHLGTGDPAVVHEFGEALCRFSTELRHLKF